MVPVHWQGHAEQRHGNRRSVTSRRCFGPISDSQAIDNRRLLGIFEERDCPHLRTYGRRLGSKIDVAKESDPVVTAQAIELCCPRAMAGGSRVHCFKAIGGDDNGSRWPRAIKVSQVLTNHKVR